MRRCLLRLSLVLAAGPACAAHGPSEPAAAPVASTAIADGDPGSPAETWAVAGDAALDLQLPGLTPVPSPIVSPDAEPPREAYPLGDGRLLIHDAYRDRIALYDPAAGAQTELGEAMLVAVPRLGWLIVPKQTPLRYCDIDPQGAGLRVLWEAPVATEPFMTIAPLAGNDRGAPLFVITRMRSAVGRVIPEPGLTLVRVIGPGRAEQRNLALPAGLTVPGADAVRDGRLLLLGDRSESVGAGGRPFVGDAKILDLVGGELRSLGEARGDWTVGTAMPHPYLVLHWSDHDPRARDLGWAEGCINVVDVATLRLVACVPGFPHG